MQWLRAVIAVLALLMVSPGVLRADDEPILAPPPITPPSRPQPATTPTPIPTPTPTPAPASSIPAFSEPLPSVDQIKLSDDWLMGKGAISVDALKQLVALAHADPETRVLLKEALAKAGVASIQELFDSGLIRLLSDKEAGVQYFQISGRQKLKSFTAGELEPGSISQTIYQPSHNVLMDPAKARAAYDAQLKNFDLEGRVYDRRKDETPDYAILSAWLDPAVCIYWDLPVAQAFMTFVHELVHFVRKDQLADDDILSYKDEEDFIQKSMHAPGGEVDAHILGFSAQIRLEKMRDGITIKEIRALFQNDGKFIDTPENRNTLAAIILDDRPIGYGYRAGQFRGRYLKRLKNARAVEVYQRNALGGRYIPALAGFAQEARAARDAARAKGDAAAEAKAVAKEQAALDQISLLQKVHARTDAEAQFARESHQRLGEDIARRDLRLEKLREKIKSLTLSQTGVSP